MKIVRKMQLKEIILENIAIEERVTDKIKVGKSCGTIKNYFLARDKNFCTKGQEVNDLEGW